ncbi:hypothetical protein GCM10027280_47580 [Micromonospora polyrhachis]
MTPYGAPYPGGSDDGGSDDGGPYDGGSDDGGSAGDVADPGEGTSPGIE